MTTGHIILDLVKSVGVPFALLIFILIRLDFYVARFLNHFGDLKKSIDALTDEVKKIKYYIHAKDPPYEN